MNELTQTVNKFITENALMNIRGKYIATLSGGPDSVALLVILVRLGYKVEAAHCNFHLRGEEADRDENFCRSLCSDMNIPLHVVHFDTFGYAEQHKVSIEMAARELRYDYFERLRKELRADGICVAHHINDTVETVLMNLIRGTGIRGLKGISVRNGYILRPLLCTTRKDIENFLSSENIASVTDSSNLVNDVTRNRIRLDILPMMEQINGNAVMNMARTARRVDEALKVFDEAINKAVESVRISEDKYSIEKLLKVVSPEYTLFTILEKYGFTPAQTEDIYANLKAETGTVYSSPSYNLLIDRGNLLLSPIDETISDEVLKIDSMEGSVSFGNELVFNITRNILTTGYSIKKCRNVATLDADKLKLPLIVRRVKTGDRFIPFGMKGSKLLSDYMTDRKFSLFKKKQQTVLTDADDNILWVVNERPDARFCINKLTSNVVEIEVGNK